eukprot:gene22327-29403_t
MAEGPGNRYNAKNRPRSKPNSLHFAVEMADMPKIEAFVKKGLVEGHAESVTLQEKEEVLGLMPIHIAFQHLVESHYLIKKQVDLDACDKYHVTALHLASIEGHADTAKALINARCNSQAPDDEGDMPIHWAATKGHHEVVRLLKLAGSPLTSKNTSGWTPLHRAAYNGRKEAANAIIKMGGDMHCKNNDGNTPLHMAVIMNHISTAEGALFTLSPPRPHFPQRVLCQNGAKQDMVNKRHKTPGDLCLNDAMRDILMNYNWKKLILGKDVPRTGPEVGEEALDEAARDLEGLSMDDGGPTTRRKDVCNEGFPDLPPVHGKVKASRDSAEKWESSAAAFMQEASTECERVSSRRSGPYGMDTVVEKEKQDAPLPNAQIVVPPPPS